METSSFAAVHRLPPEILSRIFVHWKGGALATWSPVITQVCSFWRSVALNTPEVWNQLCSAKPKTALGVYHRFPGMLLNLIFSHNEPSDTLAKIISLDPARISGLMLGQTSHLEVALAHFQARAPALKHIDIGYADVAAVEDKLLALQTPCIRYISYPSAPQRVWMAASLRSPSLRYLHISHNPHSQAALADVLDVLENLHSLEYLRFTYGLPEEPWTARKPSRIVNMSLLREIELGGTTLGCVTLLKHLELTNNIRFLAWCTPECVNYASFMLQLIESYVKLPDVELIYLAGFLRVVWGTRSNLGYYHGPDYPLSVGLSSKELKDFTPLAKILGPLLHRTASAHLKISGFSMYGLHWTPLDWHALLSPINTLRTLHVKSTGSVLASLYGGHPSAGDVLLNLRSLIIEDVGMDGDQEWPYRLHMAIATRRGNSSAGLADLEVLSFVNCDGITEADMNRFKEIVPEVTMVSDKIRGQYMQ
jgi:hypothetical protein